MSRPQLTAARTAALESTYSLVGTHSAVKLCRWQKSMLLGRGGCYKWTMYGIRSHQCIQATPNMACASNCVFCWRLNTNPVAKDWRWDIDDPEKVVQQMVDAQLSIMRPLCGMPEVESGRRQEAMSPRHCALSLVGEPIMYPRINEFVDCLHKRSISTFLVHNGQFPEAVDALKPITQLYLSVDASNREMMKKLDRPVLADFWERFNASVEAMRRKKARTVFRLTLIDGYNMGEENMNEYRDIFVRGSPHFIEVKRLTPTFQGKQDSFLRMSNVPTWERVKAFAARVCEVCPEYVLASVHEHSGCILLAQRRFIVNGKMHTWIDFDGFSRLANSGGATLAETTPEDYLLPTPEWALPSSALEGFDPQQTRKVSTKLRKFLDRKASERSSV